MPKRKRRSKALQLMRVMRDKLDESRFFLNHLREVNQKGIGGYQGAFLYYLSAYLSSSCAIRELVSKLNGGGWFRSWKNDLPADDQELLESMKNQRDKENHPLSRKAKRIDVKMKPRPAESIPGLEVFGPPALFYGQIHLEAEVAPWRPIVYTPEYFFELSDRPAEVVQTCESYLKLLRELVDKFETDHPE